MSPFGGITARPRRPELEPSKAKRFAMANSTITINSSSCLGRTCMKWGIDGELSALDLDLVM